MSSKTWFSENSNNKKQGGQHKDEGHKSRKDSGSDRNKSNNHSSTKDRLKIDPDRMIAYKALLRIDKSKAYSNIELNSILSNRGGSGSDGKYDDAVVNPAFVRELVYGVIKNRRYLDYFIDELARDGIEGVRRDIVILLRMGIYQIVFMDSVPDHAAVDETVKITKLLFPGRDGFVNGLLRQFLRQRDDNYGKPVPQFADKIKRMSVLYSCDEGLVRLLSGQYGVDGAEKILKVSQETPPLFVRVNTIKTSTPDIISLLRSHGFQADQYGQNILVVSGKGLLETDEFQDGLFFVQDASSTEAIQAFDPKAGEVLIDVCAAPGGKTFAAAMLMENQGEIHALDLHGNKLSALKKQGKTLGITIIDTEEHDAKTVNEKYIKAADKVLCDVPCSGLGVLRRKPEIKDRKLVNDGRDLAEIQYRILTASAEYVKPGGSLMYSTCTINKIENEDVIERFLSEHEDFTELCSKLTMPCSGGPDGFYYCIIRHK